MPLVKVSPFLVRQEDDGVTTWYEEGREHLLIVTRDDQVVFFEYIKDKHLLQAGRGASLRSGLIGQEEEPGRKINRARQVHFSPVVDEMVLKHFLQQLESSLDVPSAQRDGIVAMTKENFGFHNTATAKSTNQGVGKPVATNHFNSIKVWFQKFFKNLKFYALIIVLAVILFFAIFFLILYFSL